MVKASFLLKSNFYWDYSTCNPFLLSYKLLLRNIIKQFRAPFVEALMDEESSKDRFFVYPIHFHPEASTSIWGRWYTNEYNNIINISNALPVGLTLYVKEHISGFQMKCCDSTKLLKNFQT